MHSLLNKLPFKGKNKSRDRNEPVEFPNEHEIVQEDAAREDSEKNKIEKKEVNVQEEKKISKQECIVDKENDNTNPDAALLALANTIVEVWRLEQAIIQESRFIQDSRSIKRLQNQITRFIKHYFPAMSQLGLQVIDFTNREYEPGLPVNPINLSDFQADDEHLKIEFMMEPVIKKTNSTDIIHRGVVVLGRTK